MGQIKSRVVRRVVLEEDAMSEAAFEARAKELIDGGNAVPGALPIHFPAWLLISALDKGHIHLNHVSEEQKRDILAAFGAMEHEINLHYRSDSGQQVDDALKVAYLKG